MSPVPKVRLSGGLEVCRILNGMWQVSGSHGEVDKAKAGKRKGRYNGHVHERCAGREKQIQKQNKKTHLMRVGY